MDSILSQGVDALELIVVDNGSGDGTAIFIKENYPQIKLIENSLNLGSARARNQGIEVSRGEWVLSLDCDTVLSKDFLRSLKDALKNVIPEVGMIQPKILEPDKKTIYSMGIFVSFLRKFYDIGKGQKDLGQFDKIRYIFGACSAAALYRKDMLAKIKQESGYFDERFFFLFEDVDLSWRSQKNGYRAIFYPQAMCCHYGNSSETSKKKRQYLCLRNRYYTLLKNDYLINYILPLFLYDLPRLLWILIFNFSALKAIKEAFVYKKQLRRLIK